MSIPTSYTETTLAEFMHTSLGKVAQVLGLSPEAGSYGEAVNEALLRYGTDSIGSISGAANLLKLRTLAKVAAWEFVVTNFAALYDFSADGGTYNRSQLFDQAKQSLELAQAQALPYDSAYEARVIGVDHAHNPYQYRPEDETGV